MKTVIITFKALTYDGKVVFRDIPIKHDFEVIPSQKWRGVELPPTSIEQQVMQQLDETDKFQLMRDNEFEMIIDYWPKKPRKRKKKVDEIKEFMEFAKPIIDTQPSLKRPFGAIVSSSQDILFGKGKSNVTKFKEVLKIYELIMKGAHDTLNMVEAILNEPTIKKINN